MTDYWLSKLVVDDDVVGADDAWSEDMIREERGADAREGEHGDEEAARGDEAAQRARPRGDSPPPVPRDGFSSCGRPCANDSAGSVVRLSASAARRARQMRGK